jgi:hypothetical protein
MTIRRIATVLAVPALLGSAAATATAEPDTAADYADCPSGAVCYYTGPNGTGAMCQWQNADNNHAVAPVVCSWAAERNVRSIINRGTSSSYTGVCSYRGADYSGSPRVFLKQRGDTWSAAPGNDGFKVLSHRWVATNGTCPTG